MLFHKIPSQAFGHKYVRVSADACPLSDYRCVASDLASQYARILDRSQGMGTSVDEAWAYRCR
jgi:hypothetical protein